MSGGSIHRRQKLRPDGPREPAFIEKIMRKQHARPGAGSLQNYHVEGCKSALTGTLTLPMFRALKDMRQGKLCSCWHRSCVGVEAHPTRTGWSTAAPFTSFAHRSLFAT